MPSRRFWLDRVGSCEPLKVLERESNIDQSARRGRWVKSQDVRCDSVKTGLLESPEIVQERVRGLNHVPVPQCGR